MRLDAPHPESFTYFACRLWEDQVLCETDPDLLISQHGFAARGAEVAQANFRMALADRERSYRAVHRKEARKLGLDLAQPGAGWLIEQCGSLAAAIDLQAVATTSRSERRSLDNNWRPLRDTGTFVALGAWLASGAGSYSAAADSMNAHRPRIGQMDSAVDRNAVRRAVEAEIERLCRPRGAFRDREMTLCYATAWTSLHFTRTALAAWEMLHRQKGCNRVDQYWGALRPDGRLFELAAEQADLVSQDAAFSAEADRSAGVLYARVIAHLTRLLDARRAFERRSGLASATNAPAG